MNNPPNNSLPNNWNLQSVMALTYIKGMHYNECCKVMKKYANYNEFKSNAFNIKQGNFFEATDGKKATNMEIAEQQLEWANNLGIKIVSIWDADYPVLLKQIDFPPTILYVWGRLQPVGTMSVSVVGTRKNTGYGKLSTEYFVSELVKQNIVITSGMAHGIDTIAHRTVIDNGGITYAVIASGLDKIVPKLQYKLASDIMEAGGAIISEYKIGTAALQGYFLQRNRIISGISRATLVIESAYKGGALNTAKFADLYNRDVFVVPGNIFSEKSTGTNNLIHKHRAMIALSVQTMLADMGLTTIGAPLPFKSNAAQLNSPAEETIYNNLSYEPTHIDQLLEMTKLDISDLLVQLLDMEFSGVVKQLPGKYYIKGL